MRIAAIGLMGALACMPAFAAEVTLESLLSQMTDLERLARVPNPSFTCRQFSSYDRRSTDPEEKTDENWFANGDRGHFVRKQEDSEGNTEYVLMDAEGPGAIVRIWSANPAEAGDIRIYLDGAEEPTIEMPFQVMLSGEQFPFVKGIAGLRSAGWNSYFPIPYNGRCVVTATKPNFYYHINYRTYDDATTVRSYSRQVADSYYDLIQALGERLQDPGPASLPELEFLPLSPDAGHTIETAHDQPHAVKRMFAKVKAEDMAAALRQTYLMITFDHAAAPQVSAPLGDFFGAAPGVNPYEALPCGVTEDGLMYSQWVMPFRQAASFRVINFGDQEVKVALQPEAEPHDWDQDSLYFHAKWRGEQAIPTRPRQDWNFASITGRGRYVGNMLHITNPVPGWWGEGDEKIYVNGEDFPSHFGTGTEDYYGYAWGSNEEFSHAYHNQPRVDGPGNFGHTANNRFHIIDTIPFANAFVFDMEVWHWEDVKVDMAATTYWYAGRGGDDRFLKPQASQLAVPKTPEWPSGVEGALEGENLNVAEVTGGDVTRQYSSQWDWSAEAQLWWKDAEPGDRIVIDVPVEESGAYEVFAVFTTAKDYGQFDLSIAGRSIEGDFDFYNEDVVPTKRQSLGTFELEAGTVPFQAAVTGKNEAAIGGYMFGLDYLLFEKTISP